MLEEITLKNFKLFDAEGVTIRPGLVTVFIGPNGSGKSTILQALLILKQLTDKNTLKEALQDKLKLGRFDDIVKRGSQELTFGLTVSPWVPIEIEHLGALKLAWRMSFASDFYDGLKFSQLRVLSDNAIVSELNWGEELSKEGPTLMTFPVDGTDVSILPRFDRFPSGGGPSFYECTFDIGESRTSLPDGVRNELRKKLDKLRLLIKVQLQNTFLVPALRGFYRLAYPQYENVEAKVDLYEADNPEAQAQIIGTVLGAKPRVRQEVGILIERVTGKRVEPLIAPQGHFAMEAFYENDRNNIINEGSATNALIHLFTQLALAPADSFVGIEEPEVHLHPRAQAELARVLAEVSKTKQRQVAMTTHSEHILMGLVTAVAEGMLAPEELVVYYFSREGDTARVERLEVTEQGQIKGGLKGFFEVEMDEMQRYLQALAKNK